MSADPTENASEDSPRCERCGRFDTVEAAGLHLCEDCYSQSGACCSELGVSGPEST